MVVYTCTEVDLTGRWSREGFPSAVGVRVGVKGALPDEPTGERNAEEAGFGSDGARGREEAESKGERGSSGSQGLHPIPVNCGVL